MLLEFTVRDKGIVHQDAPPRPDQWKNARFLAMQLLCRKF